MRFLISDYLFPVSSKPIAGGVLVIDDQGTIRDVIPAEPTNYSIEFLERFPGFLCPGFVNTHCHLELSWAKGQITEGRGLNHFLKSLDDKRHAVPDEIVENAIIREGNTMYQSGTIAVGDISNTLATRKFKEFSPILFHTFAEVFASDPIMAETAFKRVSELASGFQSMELNNRVSVVPHATYSLSEELFRLIAQRSIEENSVISMHHQENEDENQYFMNGSGMIAGRRNYFNPGIPPFAATSKRPIESISPFFSRDQKLLLVHNTVSKEQDIDIAENYFKKLSWCFCPNANRFIENQLPDIPLFRKKGCHITLGTDSLASNDSLSIMDEVKTIAFNYPEIPLCELLGWACRNGAELLGFDQLGTFEKGKKPGIVLIENVDVVNLSLLESSWSRLLVSA